MSRSRLIEYGEKHNYDVQVINEVLTIDRPPAWSKILLIQKLLKTYDIVLWIGQRCRNNRFIDRYN